LKKKKPHTIDSMKVSDFEKNSLLYWYPRLRHLNVVMPQTEIVKISERLVQVVDGDFSVLEKYWPEITKKANKIGFPLFMRTDEFSGKHNWKNTCYVAKESDLKQHIRNLIEDSYCADLLGLPIRALVFRAYIPMKNLFTAFHGQMPVNPEMRFFIKDGKVLCKHWYWVIEAIEQGTQEGELPDNWKEILIAERNLLSVEEIVLLTNEAQKVANLFTGFWSVDFCKSKVGAWILIDMALGSMSWHPDCIHKVTE
jgi:hypothetical protein